MMQCEGTTLQSVHTAKSNYKARILKRFIHEYRINKQWCPNFFHFAEHRHIMLLAAEGQDLIFMPSFEVVTILQEKKFLSEPILSVY
jgi:hypothetical protein